MDHFLSAQDDENKYHLLEKESIPDWYIYLMFFLIIFLIFLVVYDRIKDIIRIISGVKDVYSGDSITGAVKFVGATKNNITRFILILLVSSLIYSLYYFSPYKTKIDAIINIQK